MLYDYNVIIIYYNIMFSIKRQRLIILMKIYSYFRQIKIILNCS